MKFTRILFWNFLVVVLFVPIYFTQAAGLVPCGNTGQPECTICDLAKGIDIVISYIMSLLFIVGIVVIVVAGIMYIISAGNQNMIESAKAAVKMALIGMAIALSAFVLIHFVLKAMAVKSTGPLGGTGSNSWSFSCNGGYSTGGGF